MKTKKEIFPEKLTLRKGKYRKAGSEGLTPCSACLDGNHARCEAISFIFCSCWRDKHKRKVK